MVVFTIVFGNLAKLPSEGIAPYPIMVFAGMLPWFLFSTILGDGANSLVSNANLIGKVYFPRLIVPVATSVVALVDFAISFSLLLLVMAAFGFMPDWRVLLLPFFVALAVLAAIGPALLLASLNVRYRDFRFVIPFIAQFGLYISPVGFTSSVVPSEWRLLYSVNPMVGVIDGFRWCLLAGESALYLPGLAISILVVVALAWVGLRYFRNAEKTFSDML
jgi:lipopolysaccharide transport system permease protein